MLKVIELKPLSVQRPGGFADCLEKALNDQVDLLRYPAGQPNQSVILITLYHRDESVFAVFEVTRERI